MTEVKTEIEFRALSSEEKLVWLNDTLNRTRVLKQIFEVMREIKIYNDDAEVFSSFANIDDFITTGIEMYNRTKDS